MLLVVFFKASVLAIALHAHCDLTTVLAIGTLVEISGRGSRFGRRWRG